MRRTPFRTENDVVVFKDTDPLEVFDIESMKPNEVMAIVFEYPRKCPKYFIYIRERDGYNCFKATPQPSYGMGYIKLMGHFPVIPYVANVQRVAIPSLSRDLQLQIKKLKEGV